MTADWQSDPEGWKEDNEELLNEYEIRLQKEYDEKLAKELDARHDESMAKLNIPKSSLFRHWILDENKQVVGASFGEWSVWFERNYQKRHVADTVWNFKRKKTKKEFELKGKKMSLPHFKYSGLRVSTVFLGLDHNYSEIGPPLLFETMIFGGDESEEYMWRYATWKEAEEGHKKAVELVKRKYNLPDGEEQI